YAAPNNGFILNVTASPDGRRLVLGFEGGQLGMVDLTKLPGHEGIGDALLWTVAAHPGNISTVAISDSGAVATSSAVGQVRVWAPDGSMMADLEVDHDVPPVVAFDGAHVLYYEDGPGVIRRFDLDASATIATAKSLLTRGFTPEECARQFPKGDCPQLGPR